MKKTQSNQFFGYNPENEELFFKVTVDIFERSNEDLPELAVFKLEPEKGKRGRTEDVVNQFKLLFNNELSEIKAKLEDKGATLLYDIVFLKVYTSIKYDSLDNNNLYENYYKLYVPSLEISTYSNPEFYIWKEENSVFKTVSPAYVVMVSNSSHGTRGDINSKESKDAVFKRSSKWQSRCLDIEARWDDCKTTLISFYSNEEDRITVANSLF